MVHCSSLVARQRHARSGRAIFVVYAQTSWTRVAQHIPSLLTPCRWGGSDQLRRLRLSLFFPSLSLSLDETVQDHIHPAATTNSRWPGGGGIYPWYDLCNNRLCLSQPSRGIVRAPITKHGLAQLTVDCIGCIRTGERNGPPLPPPLSRGECDNLHHSTPQTRTPTLTHCADTSTPPPGTTEWARGRQTVDVLTRTIPMCCSTTRTPATP